MELNQSSYLLHSENICHSLVKFSRSLRHYSENSNRRGKWHGDQVQSKEKTPGNQEQDQELLGKSTESVTAKNTGIWKMLRDKHTRVGSLIVATIYLQLIQNRYMFRSFTVLQCSYQNCVQPVASDVEVVGYL